MNYANFLCVKKSQVSWYVLIGSKRKMTKRYFGTTLLFKKTKDSDWFVDLLTIEEVWGQNFA